MDDINCVWLGRCNNYKTTCMQLGRGSKAPLPVGVSWGAGAQGEYRGKGGCSIDKNISSTWMGGGIDAETGCIQLSRCNKVLPPEEMGNRERVRGECRGKGGAVVTVTSVPCDWAVATMQKLLACSWAKAVRSHPLQGRDKGQGQQGIAGARGLYKHQYHSMRLGRENTRKTAPWLL